MVRKDASLKVPRENIGIDIAMQHGSEDIYEACVSDTFLRIFRASLRI